MHKTTSSFTVFQATAAIVALAILFWSIGLSASRIAEAAAVTNYSDTLSTSEPSVASDHEITFTSPTGVPNAGTISIDLSAFTGTSSIAHTDIDVSVEGTGDLTVEASCTTQEVSAAFSGDTLVITFCSGNGASLGANGTTTIEIGQNALSEASGSNQLVNPTAGSYEIPLTTSSGDAGETRVMILDTVTVTASVDTVFTFTVTGVAGGQTVNGTTTGGTTTATAIPFGELDVDTASTAAQDLTVVTNARNGFVVTVTSDGQLDSTNGADIDGFRNGNFDASPVAWESPSASVGAEETYGHWGITSDDTDYFAAAQTYVSASTTPVEIYSHTGPTDGSTTGEGTTRVGYTVEVSPLQEAAEDYQAILTYVATPTF